MRKYLALVLVALLVMGVQTAQAAAGHAQIPAGITKSPGIGEIKEQGYDSTPGKTFRKVRYIPATPVTGQSIVISKDSIVIWNTGASGDDGVTVTTTTTSGDMRVAGIIVQNVQWVGTRDMATLAFDSIGQENWTWLQTYGISQVDMVPTGAVDVTDGNAAAGYPLCTGITAGGAFIWTRPQAATLAGGSQCGIAGFFLDACSEGSTDVEVFLKGLD